jgi:hypothetical protein
MSVKQAEVVTRVVCGALRRRRGTVTRGLRRSGNTE